MGWVWIREVCRRDLKDKDHSMERELMKLLRAGLNKDYHLDSSEIHSFARSMGDPTEGISERKGNTGVHGDSLRARIEGEGQNGQPHTFSLQYLCESAASSREVAVGGGQHLSSLLWCSQCLKNTVDRHCGLRGLKHSRPASNSPPAKLGAR